MYVAAVLVLAAVAFIVYTTGDRTSVPKAVATPAVLFIGAVAALIKTYRDWRAERTWPIWQGAGWFLLALSLLTLGVPAMGMLG